MQATAPLLVADGPAVRETGLVHRVLEPSGPGPYPTVVMLHGRYGNEDVMWIFRKTVPANWLMIAPRALVPDHGGYSWLRQEGGFWPPLAAFDTAVDAVVRFVESLSRVYNADLEQIYLMGFSQGAAVAYATAMRRPDLVQAIAGLVGFVPESCESSPQFTALQDLPIFMAVGREDERVPYERAQACAQTLRLAGANLEYHEYDTGHKVNSQGLQDLANWWSRRNRERRERFRI